MLASIKAWIYGAAAGAIALIGVMLYRKGHEDATNDAKLEDTENAEELRRRVSVERDRSLRQLAERGYRD